MRQPAVSVTTFPSSILRSVVYLIINSLDLATWKERKMQAQALRPIYTAANTIMAAAVPDVFELGP